MQIDKILTSEIQKTGGIWITVHGNSMFPTITDGQKVYLAPCSEYTIGEIIAYKVKSDACIQRILVHRVIFVRKNYILAKGDNNSYIDPVRIKYEDIIGKVSIY